MLGRIKEGKKRNGRETAQPSLYKNANECRQGEWQNQKRPVFGPSSGNGRGEMLKTMGCEGSGEKATRQLQGVIHR